MIPERFDLIGQSITLVALRWRLNGFNFHDAHAITSRVAGLFNKRVINWTTIVHATAWPYDFCNHRCASFAA
jgi:hypothetical protein